MRSWDASHVSFKLDISHSKRPPWPAIGMRTDSSYRGWAALHAAIAHIDLEQYNAAKVLFEQALAREPGHIAAKLGLGVYHSNLGVRTPRIPRPRIILRKVLRFCRNRQAAGSDERHRLLHHLGVALQGTTRLVKDFTRWSRRSGSIPATGERMRISVMSWRARHGPMKAFNIFTMPCS